MDTTVSGRGRPTRAERGVADARRGEAGAGREAGAGGEAAAALGGLAVRSSPVVVAGGQEQGPSPRVFTTGVSLSQCDPRCFNDRTESAYAKTPWPGVVLWLKTIYLCKFRSII